jgi:RNA polymerase sigma factor (sigma-70 family)
VIDARDRARVSQATLDRCRRGDVDAFRALFDAYADRMYSIALAALDGHEAAARDVVQQVFVKLITHVDRFRGDAEFSTWLYRIVVNACADERRRRRRLIFFSERPQIVEIADPRSAFEDASQREADRDVRRAVGHLPRAIRMTVLLALQQRDRGVAAEPRTHEAGPRARSPPRRTRCVTWDPITSRTNCPPSVTASSIRAMRRACRTTWPPVRGAVPSWTR